MIAMMKNILQKYKHSTFLPQNKLRFICGIFDTNKIETIPIIWLYLGRNSSKKLIYYWVFAHFHSEMRRNQKIQNLLPTVEK